MTLMMKPTATTCMAISLLIPNMEQAIGITAEKRARLRELYLD